MTPSCVLDQLGRRFEAKLPQPLLYLRLGSARPQVAFHRRSNPTVFVKKPPKCIAQLANRDLNKTRINTLSMAGGTPHSSLGVSASPPTE